MFIRTSTGSTTTNSNCKFLKSPFTASHLKTCEDDPLELPEVNKSSYATADFSNFNQKEYDMFAEVTIGIVKRSNDRTFTGNFFAAKSSLEEITIGFTSGKHPMKFHLERNGFLKKVNITTKAIASNFKITFIIRGNKRLELSSIQTMKNLSFLRDDSVIQGEGECILDNPLPSIADLEDCKYTDGALTITSATTVDHSLHEKIRTTLAEVRGCIKITGSDLKDIDFLKNVNKAQCPGSHEVTGNSKLCLHPEVVKEFKTRLGNLNYAKPADCIGQCSSKYLQKEKDTECVIITDTLTITGVVDSEELKHLHQVKEIRGQLLIKSNNFSDLNFFPNLETVDANATGKAAIEIRFNDKMTSIDFPKLKKIISQTRVFVYQNAHPMNPSLEAKLRKEYNDRVYIDQEAQQTIYNITGNSTSRLIEEKGQEDNASGGLEIGEILGIIFGSLGALALLAILIYAFIVLKITVSRRKEFKKHTKPYAVILRTNLKLPETPLVVYPWKEKTPWIDRAAAIMKDNQAKIVAQHEELTNEIKKGVPVFFYKNGDAVAPFLSRSNENFKEYSHSLGLREKRGCCQGCVLSSLHVKHWYCISECSCDDFGVLEGKKRVFGVRMEENGPQGWDPNELEKIHEAFFQGFGEKTLPIVYEEGFDSTAKRMQELPNSMIAEEKQYLEGNKTGNDECFITGKNLKFLKAKQEEKAQEDKEKRAKDLRLPTKACVYRFTISLHFYQPAKNELGDISRYTVRHLPNFALTYFRQFFTFKSFSSSDRNFFEYMIKAHMSAPLNRWVVSYMAEDFISLCESVKETFDDKAVVSLKCINVRIIGEIRGQFDDLRRGLCLPSVNGEKDTHPVCSVKHVFLGNYVGPRGSNMEVLCLLFALKCRYPENYVLLRGAMEWEEMADVSGLKVEVFSRFSEKAIDVYNAINDIFSHLPIACEIGDNVLCTHAGIAPRMRGELKNIELPINNLEPDSLVFNMMFAQPNYTVKRYFDNVEQNAGYYFGQMAFANEAMKRRGVHEIRPAAEELEEKKNQKMSRMNSVVFCSKVLESGFGIFDACGRLYSLCGHRSQNTAGFHLAQAEYSEMGALTFHVIVSEQTDDEEWNPSGELSEAAKRVKSQMSQISKVQETNGEKSGTKSAQQAVDNKSGQSPKQSSVGNEVKSSAQSVQNSTAPASGAKK